MGPWFEKPFGRAAPRTHSGSAASLSYRPMRGQLEWARVWSGALSDASYGWSGASATGLEGGAAFFRRFGHAAQDTGSSRDARG